MSELEELSGFVVDIGGMAIHALQQNTSISADVPSSVRAKHPPSDIQQAHQGLQGPNPTRMLISISKYVEFSEHASDQGWSFVERHIRALPQ